MSLFIFIMAGGTGERFWPMSRTRTPKHLLHLLSEKTLLGEAVDRALGVVPTDHVFVLTNAAQLESCRAAVPHLPAENFIAEPAKRDTAPAAALATGFARARQPDAICALLPADAMIHDTATFQRQLSAAAQAVTGTDAVLTFSIEPTYAATGFGYLELGDPVPGQSSEICRVARFVEKPNIDLAEEYLASGRHGWNAGMFLWSANTFLTECDRLAPGLSPFIREFPDGDCTAYLARTFESLPKISVDYAIMERAANVIAVRAAFDWDDVGTWTSLPNHLGTDEENNTSRGPAVAVDSHNNITVSNGRTIALCGVSDLVVVETDDAILVCHRNSAQRVKQLQAHLPKELQ